MVLLLRGYHETVLIRLGDESDADGALNIRHTTSLPSPFYEHLKGFSLVLPPC